MQWQLHSTPTSSEFFLKFSFMFDSCINYNTEYYTVLCIALSYHKISSKIFFICRAIENELATLIASKEVDGRIDSHAKALFSKKVNARSTTFKHALTAAEQYMQGTKSLLLRASMMRHDLIQRAPAGDRAPERPEVPGGIGRHGRPQMHGRERDRQEGRHRNRMGDRDRFAMENLGSGSGSMESHDLVNAGGMLAD